MNHIKLTLLLLCLTSISQAFADYPFEKVFTVKSQRIQIDQQRLQSETTRLPVEPSKNEVPKEQLSKTNQIRFSGYLKRKDGSEVYWHEGKTELGSRALDISVEKADVDGAFIFHTTDSQASLRPGQVWLVDEEKIVERYELQDSELQSGEPNRPEMKPNSDLDKTAKHNDTPKK